VSSSGNEQIRGWKEIASYFDRDERTVKRWEKQRALPVRRIPGEGRANVYIVVSEAEAWLAAGHHIVDGPVVDSPVVDSPATGSIDVAAISPAVLRAEAYPSASPAAIPLPATASPPAALSEPASDRSDAVVHHTTHLPDPHRPRAFIGYRAFTVLLVGAAIVVIAWTMLRGPRSAPRGASAQPHATNLRRPPQTNTDALYLQGVYFTEQRTPADLKRALDSFQSAIAIDPRSARAYSGLAITYLLLREYGTMPDADAYIKAQVAAQKALALEPNMPEAHAALGFIDFFSSWNPQQATTEFKTALQLNPDCVIAHHWYGSMLTHQGMYTEALQQLDMAQQLEPTSAAILSSKAFALGLAGRRDEAMALLQPLVASNSTIASPHRILSTLSLMLPRDIPRYLKEMRRFDEIRDSQDTVNLDYGAAAFRRGGERAMWTAMLAREKEIHSSPDQPTYFMAEADAALGLDNEAIRVISILAQQHDPAVIGIGIDPMLSPLRQDPRFQQILASVGLAPSA
jgi:Tfp pilus assembly protein PilF